jgi:hypothetical protein
VKRRGRPSVATRLLTDAEYWEKWAASMSAKGPTCAAVAYGMLSVLKGSCELSDETLRNQLQESVAPLIAHEDETYGVAANAERS